MTQGTKRDRDALREQMIAARAPRRVIKDEMMRRWALRPRQAWRPAHGWSLQAMAAAYNARNDHAGRAAMSASRLSAYERWPGNGERPTLPVLLRFAHLFDTTLDQVVDADDWSHLSDGDRLAIMELTRTVTVVPVDVPDLPTPRSTTYRGKEDADPNAGQGEVVTMTAHESSEHAEEAERRDIGDATLDQLRADVTRLSHEYLTGEPFAMFQEMRRVRTRIHTALERKLWPRDQNDLYFLLGVLNGLMATAANSLGNVQAAEELIRAGWAYASVVGHGPLMAHLRMELASFSLWDSPRRSRDLLSSGLRYLSDGPNAAQLHLKYAAATALIGDAPEVHRAIRQAEEAQARDHNDELLEIGGQLGFSRATQHWMAGDALIEVPQAGEEAGIELEEAARLYEAGPGPGEQHSEHCIAKARVDLAVVRLRAGELDGAAEALQPVLSLTPNRRIASLPRRLRRVRGQLALTTYQGQPLAAELDEHIEEFSQQTIAGDLGELPRS